MNQRINRTHVLPINDAYEHIESIACACHPITKENGMLIIHNSFDGREKHEQKDIEPSKQEPSRQGARSRINLNQRWQSWQKLILSLSAVTLAHQWKRCRNN